MTKNRKKKSNKKSNKKLKSINIKQGTQEKLPTTKASEQATTLGQPGRTYYAYAVSIAKKTLIVISFILNLLAGYFIFLPRLAPSIILPQSTTAPLEIFLNLTNSGYFDISDIECRLGDAKYSANVTNPLTLYTHDPTGKLKGIDKVKIDVIKPNHTESVDLRKMFGLLMERADSASFSVTISYSVWYLPGIRLTEEIRRYELSKTITGTYTWRERSPFSN